QIEARNHYYDPNRIAGCCSQTRNYTHGKNELPALGFPELQRQPNNQGAQLIAQDVSPHKMCVDHLHWENSIAECAEKRRIESLTRFSNRKKYDSNGTEIE